MTLSVKSSNDIDDETKQEMDELKEGIADLFIEKEVETQMALSVLVTLYVITAKEMLDMTKEEAIKAVTTAIELCYAEDEREEVKWLN